MEDLVLDLIQEFPDRINVKGNQPSVLIVEPFYGGSHKELIDTLCDHIDSYTLVTLSAKKWHWRSRCAALCLLRMIPEITTEKVLFCSSVVNLAELIGMRADLVKLRKIIYFHENQLIYPIQKIKERDVQYSYNQITSSIAADIILFNSHFNKNSFLKNIKNVIKLIPDFRPKYLAKTLDKKCSVLYFPVSFPKPIVFKKPSNEQVLIIVWPHRWEFDKGPEDFFNVLLKLKSECVSFKLAILGECYKEIPEVISKAKEKLIDHIIHCGYLDSKQDYFKMLSRCDVAVSTSKHEFFGVAMLEAVHCGCLPLVPNTLVYPEIYPNNCLYSSLDNLFMRLKKYCQFPELAREERNILKMDLKQYSVEQLVPQFLKLLSGDET